MQLILSSLGECVQHQGASLGSSDKKKSYVSLWKLMTAWGKLEKTVCIIEKINNFS